jgi:hypothetical protein
LGISIPSADNLIIKDETDCKYFDEVTYKCQIEKLLLEMKLGFAIS